MKVGIIVDQPMHFDPPFFRFVASTAQGALTVIYTSGASLSSTVVDREVGTKLSLGEDLLTGYPYSVMPERRSTRWMSAHLHSNDYDMLIVNGYSTSGALRALLAGMRSTTPLSLRLDSALFNNTSRAKLAAKSGLFAGLRRICRHFFAVSGSTAALLNRLGVGDEDITRFPYTVDLKWFEEQSQLARGRRAEIRRRYGLPADPTPVILSVAKFNMRESPWDLLHAFAEMTGEDACLWLIGDGPERARLEARARLGRAGRVIFSGYMTLHTLPDAYAASDVFVHPARNEPWGVSVQEALAAGLPVVASARVGSALDLVVQERNGYLYEVGDVADLRRRLEGIVFSGDLSDVTDENRRVLSDYTYAAIWSRVRSVAEALGGT